MPNGIPSHDTFNRFFSALDPAAFEQAFLSWIKDISELTDGDVISIDGKTLCGSRGGDCLLAVKGNQGCLAEDTERTVRFAKPTSEWVEDDFGHGRIEQRKCTLYHDLSFIDNAEAWKNLTAIVKIEATRYIKSSGKEEKERAMQRKIFPLLIELPSI
ncbi:hypothetical protein FACS1894123_03720 [Bacteroidia bacterium]|nr:hypothetical protein FACS1894123_03720 [Bacteroidia bacterium]